MKGDSIGMEIITNISMIRHRLNHTSKFRLIEQHELKKKLDDLINEYNLKVTVFDCMSIIINAFNNDEYSIDPKYNILHIDDNYYIYFNDETKTVVTYNNTNTTFYVDSRDISYNLKYKIKINNSYIISHWDEKTKEIKEMCLDILLDYTDTALF